MSYVNNLQSAWDRYVVMKQAEVIQVCDQQSAVFDADFAQALGIIYSQKMFGFANYGPAAGSNSYKGNSPITNGPITS